MSLSINGGISIFFSLQKTQNTGRNRFHCHRLFRSAHCSLLTVHSQQLSSHCYPFAGGAQQLQL